jgi:hypothetical protein
MSSAPQKPRKRYLVGFFRVFIAVWGTGALLGGGQVCSATINTGGTGSKFPGCLTGTQALRITEKTGAFYPSPLAIIDTT